jgi:hypothetical protein
MKIIYPITLEYDLAVRVDANPAVSLFELIIDILSSLDLPQHQDFPLLLLLY